MNVFIFGPEHTLQEWRSVEIPEPSAINLIYSTEKTPGNPWLKVPDAIFYLFPEQDSTILDWLETSGAPICIVNNVIHTSLDLRPKMIRINAWTGFLSGTITELAAPLGVETKDIDELMNLMGRKSEWVPDQVGMISPRVLACIINEAFYAIEDQVSSETEIDVAMKMGTNYPLGPVEWGKKIGLALIYQLLNELSITSKRYTPSSLLKKEALA